MNQFAFYTLLLAVLVVLVIAMVIISKAFTTVKTIENKQVK